MPKYKVLVEFEGNAVDSEVELTEEVAAPLVEAGTVSKVEENA